MSTLGSPLANPRVQNLKLHSNACPFGCTHSQRAHLLAAGLLALWVLASLVGCVQAVCQAGVAIEVAAVMWVCSGESTSQKQMGQVSASAASAADAPRRTDLQAGQASREQRRVELPRACASRAGAAMLAGERAGGMTRGASAGR